MGSFKARFCISSRLSTLYTRWYKSTENHCLRTWRFILELWSLLFSIVAVAAAFSFSYLLFRGINLFQEFIFRWLHGPWQSWKNLRWSHWSSPPDTTNGRVSKLDNSFLADQHTETFMSFLFFVFFHCFCIVVGCELQCDPCLPDRDT